jgi:hypothetical protein
MFLTNWFKQQMPPTKLENDFNETVDAIHKKIDDLHKEATAEQQEPESESFLRVLDSMIFGPFDRFLDRVLGNTDETTIYQHCAKCLVGNKGELESIKEEDIREESEEIDHEIILIKPMSE